MGAADKPGGVACWRRQDVCMFLCGAAFIGALIGAMFGFGSMRSWYAPSGYEHDTSPTSAARFISEPCVNDTYYSYRGRFGSELSDLRAKWYYWQLKPWEVTPLTRLFVWHCYVGHQLSIWLVIYLAQLDKAESSGPKYSTDLTRYNWICFALNVIFHVIHLVQTHITYDALAQDVVITSSQSSVIMLLVLVMLLQYTERGLFFGWPTLKHTGKISTKLRMTAKPIHLLRKYHGYAFAWAAIYTFWYHPMENTYGHAMGFVYTWMLLLQGSMMYTKLHMNRWWRLFQEVWVVVHGGLVAVQTGGPEMKGTTLWPMFVFGFLWLLALTQIFLLDFWNKIPGWVRIFPVLICTGVTLGNYAWIPDKDGRTWVRIQEIIRIPAIYYLCVVFAWALMYFFMWVEKKVKGEEDQKPKPISKIKQGICITAFLFVYAILVGISAFFQLASVSIMMFVSMVLLIFVFITGACISFMLVNQIVPKRSFGLGESSQSSPNGSNDNMKEVIGSDLPAKELPEMEKGIDNPVPDPTLYAATTPRDSPRESMAQIEVP